MVFDCFRYIKIESSEQFWSSSNKIRIIFDSKLVTTVDNDDFISFLSNGAMGSKFSL